MTQQRKSIYRRGAESGMVMGVYLSVLFLAIAYASTSQWLGLMSLAMVVSVPLLTYRLLRQAYRADGGNLCFSELWMEGTVIFAGGSLIMAVVAFAFMRWVEPSFIVTQVASVAEIYRESGQAQVAEMVDRAVDQHLLPSPAEVAVEFVWFGVFSGSLLSMLMALLVRARRLAK